MADLRGRRIEFGNRPVSVDERLWHDEPDIECIGHIFHSFERRLVGMGMGAADQQPRQPRETDIRWVANDPPIGWFAGGGPARSQRELPHVCSGDSQGTHARSRDQRREHCHFTADSSRFLLSSAVQKQIDGPLLDSVWKSA